MSGSQPFIDDRRRGLEERLTAPFATLDSPMSDARRAAIDVHAGPPGLDMEAMARQLECACRHGAIIERVAARHGLLPSLIAGLCSRRSGFGLDLSPAGVDGTRDFEAREVASETRRSPLPPDGLGFERGLMALDYDRHPLAREPLWRDPESNIEAAIALVAAHRTTLRRRTTLQGAGLLRASLSAFECGLDAVERTIRLGLDVDSAGAGGNSLAQSCGRDVLARARFFQAEGWD